MIEGSRCPSCARVAVPPEPRCLSCRSETDEERFPRTATVLARTRTRPQGAWIVLAELDGGARVLAEARTRPGIGGSISLAPAEGDRTGAFTVRER